MRGLINTHLADPTETAGTTMVAGCSPFRPKYILELFLRPTRFFSRGLPLGNTANVILVTWAFGMCGAIDRIDSPSVQRGFPWMVATWPATWGTILALGAAYGALYWLLGGWWCRVRLKWSGAPSPDKRLARLLYVYSGFVCAVPYLVTFAGQTIAYPNYLAAYNAPVSFPLIGLLVLVAVFWSIGTLYKGVLALVPVRRNRARWWFIGAPVLFYVALWSLPSVMIWVATRALEASRASGS